MRRCFFINSQGLLEDIAAMALHICFPVSCPVCGKIATEGCISCFSDQVAPLLPRCSVCGGAHPCSRHRKSYPVISGNLHEKLPRELVLELKYGKNERIGRLMGQALCGKINLPDCDILVPVPLHKGSKRRYNQALALSRGISDILNKRISDILYWSYRAGSQSLKKNRDEKRSLPEGSIGVKSVAEGARAVIVDDVITTGTTLSRCSEALKKSGYMVVGAVTWTASAK